MKPAIRRHRQGFAFTLVELLVVVAIIALLLGILLPAINRAREVTRRTLCGTNLAGISKAMRTYAAGNSNNYPKSSDPDYNQQVFGFQHGLDRDSDVPDDVLLKNNATASLWLLIRLEGATPDLFICPSSQDKEDPLTDDGMTTGSPVQKEFIFDFARRENLSYSMMHLYHEIREDNWSPLAHPAWILMADNNNAENSSTTVHQNEAHNSPSAAIIQNEENSTNHDKQGQVFLFADGHTEFSNDPFVGPTQDNAYARDVAAAGSLEEADVMRNRSNNSAGGLVNKPDQDTVMLPLSGGDSGNRNLDPADGGRTPN